MPNTTPAPTRPPTITTHLAEAPLIGDPQISGPLAVFPLLGPMPTLDYRSFAQALAHGVKITELAGGASVNDLTVHNPTDTPVLLFEGEEVLGAQQNRTFDVSVLVAANSRLDVPVSCVEAGRWDHSRHAEAFTPAPQAAHPSLRRLKNEHAASARAMSAEPRANQGTVWNAVAARLSDHDVDSATGAMDDVYLDRGDRLVELTAPLHMCCSQTGMIVAIGGRFTVLDRVSQPDVLDALFAPLVQGYALDALDVPEHLDAAPPTTAQAAAFLERVLALRITEHDGIGMGCELRAAGTGLAGAGLVVDHDLIQLSVFAADTDNGSDSLPPTARAARVLRPSRRSA